MAMVVCMCLGISSCTHRNREIEGIAQRELGYYKDFYVIALQTGRVKLPKGGQNPHVTHPGMGGVETPINQVWLVPFIEAIGGTAKDKTKDYTYTFRLDCRDPKLPLLTDKEMLEP